MTYQGKKPGTPRTGGGSGPGTGGNNRSYTRPPTQHIQANKPPKKRLRLGRIFLILFLLSLVFSLTGLALYGFYLEKKVVESTAVTAPLPEGKPVNVLLIGIDRDPNSADKSRKTVMNTDTILVARINPASHKAHLLSIPRDTRVKLPTGMEKINAAYAIGGMDRLKKTTEELTGLSIDRYMMIDFPAFVKLVDTLGGMEFDVDKPLYDPEGTVSLQPGKQQLNGAQALAVVRFRSEEMGDIARVKRQQRFLEAAIAKMEQSSVVDWMKGIRAMSDSLRTDMTIQEMGTLATSLQAEGAQVTTHTLPGEFLDLYGVSYWKPDMAALETLVSQFKQ